VFAVSTARTRRSCCSTRTPACPSARRCHRPWGRGETDNSGCRNVRLTAGGRFGTCPAPCRELPSSH